MVTTEIFETAAPGESGALAPAGFAAAADPALRGDELEWIAASEFFLVAIVIALVNTLLLHLQRQAPNGYMIAAFFTAVMGLGLLPLSYQREACHNVGVPMPDAGSWSMFAVLVAFFAFYTATCTMQPTGYNEPVRQAYAYLHDHIWVQLPGAFMEHITWKGHTYLVHPPMPAIVLMPFVAIWGLATNQTAVDVLMGALEIALGWRLLRLLGVKIAPRVWLTLFFGIGTTLWFEATVGNSWNFVVVTSVLMTLLALNELFGQARPWLLGFLTAFAGLSRNDLLPICPLYALMLLTRGRRWQEMFGMLPGWLFGALIYLGLNELRYGTVMDIWMWLYYPTDPYRFAHPWGPISLRYVPENLYLLFFQAPTFSDTFPYVHPSGMGQALVFTSPAFILALRANFRRRITILVAAATVIAGIPPLLWYANGFVQFGARYYVELFPFLLVLMGFGAKRHFDQLSKALIVVSIGLVTFGVWHIRTIGFG